MIKVVILEDESPSRAKLRRFLDQLSEEVALVAELDSVESGIEFFSGNPEVDLLISDIELLDGNAFQIFDATPISCPILFTTAYNQFWMEAFEGNGIAYLLKPFGFEQFQKAWDKFRRMTSLGQSQSESIESLRQLLGQQAAGADPYRKRLKVPTSKGAYFLEIAEVSFFLAENAVVWAVDRLGKRHLLQEPTLKEIEAMLDPTDFFRISRSHLVQKKFVLGTERYSKNAVAIRVAGADQLLLCSQSATPGFSKWVEV